MVSRFYLKPSESRRVYILYLPNNCAPGLTTFTIKIDY